MPYYSDITICYGCFILLLFLHFVHRSIQDLEPGFVGEVRIAGDIKLLSVIASGLPTTEDFEHVMDLETLKAPPVPMDKFVDLFVGVFSTANNFKRRMAVRRTWMQYDVVRSAKVAVRFFVGLVRTEI